MAKTRKTAQDQPQTTAQQISSLIKSARDIMRKDKGLSTDIDRLPLLTWIMFLKFLDDMEQIEETKATMRAERYRPAIETPYRWRDWAADEAGITGPELLAFVNQDEAIKPDGSRGPGLLAYLRNLEDGNNTVRRREVVTIVFRDITCRMLSGYLLRDVINEVNGIHFSSQEEVFTLGHLYETMLREMRDAAGENGEFYTPRPVVKFVVEVVNPQLGETVLDPACGTGGFLVEAYQHLEKQCETVEHRSILQNKSLYGGEAKPLPFLLCQMNLLLHGMEAPEIDPGNSLRFKLTEIGDKDRVDVVLTNPPFGGEEEAGIRGNFPSDMQTSETALLFLQLIMRRLSRGGGRAAVVVPNGTLFGDGVYARIKEQLLQEFNLHTIVRLPEGVFAPYTNIPTNILFFDRLGSTKDVWYYEHPLPESRKNYTKTKPIQFEEFVPCLEWWDNRKENEQAWKISAEELLENNCNLDLKNPRSKEELVHLPPEKLVASIIEKEKRILEIMAEIKDILSALNTVFGRTDLKSFLTPIADADLLLNRESRNPAVAAPDDRFLYVDISSLGQGPSVLNSARKLLGKEAPSRARRVIHTDDVIFSTCPR